MKKIGKDFIRYENDNGRLDNKGPALIQFKKDGTEYLEWWESGILLAVYNDGVLKRTEENSFTSLKDVVVPEKYKGLENTLNISDIRNFSYDLNKNIEETYNKEYVEVEVMEPINYEIKKVQKTTMPKIEDGYNPEKNYDMKSTSYIEKFLNGVGRRYENKNGKLHNVNGPALDSSDYFEWYDNGRLVATYDKNKNELKRSVNGDFSGLKEVSVKKEHWKNRIEYLSLHDISLCDFKPETREILAKEVYPEITDGYVNNFTEKLKTETKYSSHKTEEFLPNGQRHCNDGPALYSTDLKHFEWYDKGRLVATYNQETNELKRSIDGTYEGLKDAVMKDKWKNRAVSLSLHDISLCAFKPELMEVKKVMKEVEIDKSFNKNAFESPKEISSKISQIRQNSLNLGQENKIKYN